MSIRLTFLANEAYNETMNTVLAQGTTISVKTGNVPTNISQLLTWGLYTLFIIAGIIVAYNIIQGGLAWVQSAGDKEKVEKARTRITSSVIGLVILFATIALIALVEQIFGVGLGLTKPIYIAPICPGGCLIAPR